MFGSSQASRGSGSIKSKMAADDHLRYTKSHNFVTGLPMDVMFGSRVGFPGEIRFLP